MSNKKIKEVNIEEENIDDYFLDFYEEDFELLNEPDETVPPIKPIDNVTMLLDEQIFLLDFVNETYLRLLNNHTVDEAMDLMYKVLQEELNDMEKENRPLDENKYKKALEKLK